MRVIIVEDQTLLREGLAGLLRDTGHDVVASLGDCDGVEDAVREYAPDVVVLDVRLPPSFTDEGARAAAALKSTCPDMGVLLLSQHIETAHSMELAGQGGFCYLLKDRILESRISSAPSLESLTEARRSTLRWSPGSSTAMPVRTALPSSPSASTRYCG